MYQNLSKPIGIVKCTGIIRRVYNSLRLVIKDAPNSIIVTKVSILYETVLAYLRQAWDYVGINRDNLWNRIEVMLV